MFASNQKFAAVAFVDATSVSPNTDDITYFLTEFPQFQLIPQMLQESSPQGISNRLGFVSADGSWQFFLVGDKFQLAKIAADPAGSNMGDFGEFCDQASIVLSRALNRYERRSHRLAIVREGFLREMNEQEMTQKARILMNFSETFNNNLFEWDWRVASHTEKEFAQLRETFNIIAAIKRQSGQIISVTPEGSSSQASITRIRVSLDINVEPTNTRARFGPNEIQAFYAESVTWQTELENEIARLLREEHNDEEQDDRSDSEQHE